MNAAAHPASAQRPAQSRASAARLIEILESSHALYTQLLAQIRARREAIRTADFVRLEQLENSEQVIAARLALLDQDRTAEVAALAVRLALAPGAALTDIAARLGEQERARLDIVRCELRTLIEETRRESSILRQASDRLSSHMAGILQTVHSAMAHAKVYSRGGRIAVGQNVVSSLDIRS